MFAIFPRNGCRRRKPTRVFAESELASRVDPEWRPLGTGMQGESARGGEGRGGVFSCCVLIIFVWRYRIKMLVK